MKVSQVAEFYSILRKYGKVQIAPCAGSLGDGSGITLSVSLPQAMQVEINDLDYALASFDAKGPFDPMTYLDDITTKRVHSAEDFQDFVSSVVGAHVG
jgi:hypothetical protein